MKPDLDAIRARCEAATPGPWKVCGSTYDEDCREHLAPFSLEDSDEHLIWSSGGGEYAHPDMPTAQFIAHARTDIPALLAHVDMLEHMLEEERQNVDTLRAAVEDAHPAFASCNRARQHCELECEDLRKQNDVLKGQIAAQPVGRWTPGETEWANRIAHAEARFVEEYDMRKAAERQVEELKARIADLEAARNDETFDGTDAAHPAWWRGNDAGVRGAVNAVHRMLADAIPDSGAFGAEELNDLHARIKSMLAEIAELKARIVTLEAMR